jgi:hypothetical protein
LCYKTKKQQRFFETRNLIRRAKKGKTLEVEMIRDKEQKLFGESGLRKKGSPQRVSFPLWRVFYFNPSSNGGYYVKRTSKVVQRSEGLWIY